MWIVTKLLTILFPPQCILCKKEKTSLCLSCAKKCTPSIETPYLWIYATYSYKDVSIKKCIQLIKYYHRKDLIHPLVQSTHTQNLLDFIGNSTNSILVPIPSPRSRVLLRGYNHAELVAKEYSEMLTIPVVKNLLIRDHYTSQQAKTKNASARVKNIAHAFTINTSLKEFFSKNILLVDDTTTTGATLAESKKTLEKYGFRNIKAITLAH